MTANRPKRFRFFCLTEIFTRPHKVELLGIDWSIQATFFHTAWKCDSHSMWSIPLCVSLEQRIQITSPRAGAQKLLERRFQKCGLRRSPSGQKEPAASNMWYWEDIFLLLVTRSNVRDPRISKCDQISIGEIWKSLSTCHRKFRGSELNWLGCNTKIPKCITCYNLLKNQGVIYEALCCKIHLKTFYLNYRSLSKKGFPEEIRPQHFPQSFPKIQQQLQESRFLMSSAHFFFLGLGAKHGSQTHRNRRRSPEVNVWKLLWRLICFPSASWMLPNTWKAGVEWSVSKRKAPALPEREAVITRSVSPPEQLDLEMEESLLLTLIYFWFQFFIPRKLCIFGNPQKIRET